MNKCREVSIRNITCDLCGQCDPWVLCVCYTCGKEWWRRATLAGRWCEICLEKEISTARLLLVTGHELGDTDRYFSNLTDWAKIVTDQAREILACGLECSRINLVPAIWPVLRKDWDRTKKECERRFAWKLEKGWRRQFSQ